LAGAPQTMTLDERRIQQAGRALEARRPREGAVPPRVSGAQHKGARHARAPLRPRRRDGNLLPCTLPWAKHRNSPPAPAAGAALAAAHGLLVERRGQHHGWRLLLLLEVVLVEVLEVRGGVGRRREPLRACPAAEAAWWRPCYTVSDKLRA